MENSTKSKVYTVDDWDKDGSLKPHLFQEVSHEIYSDMYTVLPPLPLEGVTRQILENQLNTTFAESFCMGEASTSDDDGHTLYEAFAKTIEGKFIYLGARRAGYAF